MIHSGNRNNIGWANEELLFLLQKGVVHHSTSRASVHTLSCCLAEYSEELALDFGSELHQLTATIQVLVARDHLRGGSKTLKFNTWTCNLSECLCFASYSVLDWVAHCLGYDKHLIRYKCRIQHYCKTSSDAWYWSTLWTYRTLKM